jgi:hypothetical protein
VAIYPFGLDLLLRTAEAYFPSRLDCQHPNHKIVHLLQTTHESTYVPKFLRVVLSQVAGKKRGKANKSKAGMKFCAPCGKQHPTENFPMGKAICAPAFNAIRSIKNAATAQGQEEWLEDVMSNPTKLRLVVTAYLVRVSPEVTGRGRAKKNAFCIAQYKDRRLRKTGCAAR